METIEYALTILKNDYKHVLEFGVFEGRTISKLREKLPLDYKIFGFDSFEGLPEDWKGTVCNKGFFSTNGKIPDVKDVTFYKGWFDNTLPEYLKIAENISLLHVDCDLYSSTKTIFNSLHAYIKTGTIIVFDEWIYNNSPRFNDHEQKAFYEYVNEFNVKFKLIDFHDITPCGNERKIVEIL